MRNIVLPVIKLCLVGCSLLLYFKSFFELRMYEITYEWLRLLLSGRAGREEWQLHVCLASLLVSQTGILLSIGVPMRRRWQVALASGLVVAAVGLGAIAGHFVLTLSWVLLGVLYATLLGILIPRAESKPGAKQLFH